jgi:hypothetical protein
MRTSLISMIVKIESSIDKLQMTCRKYKAFILYFRSGGVAEWLRRQIQDLLWVLSRAGSNPAPVSFSFQQRNQYVWYSMVWYGIVWYVW